MSSSLEYSNISVLLIEGFSRQVLPMMKSLHKMGCKITTYNNSRLDIGYTSRYPDKKLIRYCNSENRKKTYEILLDELKTGEYDIVIPLTDFAAILLSEHFDEYSQYATLAVNNWADIQYAIDKLNTMRVCMENGIPCPQTFISNEEFFALDDSAIKFPLVVKPRTGFAAVGFQVVHNRMELLDYLDKAERKFGPCLIQEYIPQTDLQYKCEMFVDVNGNIAASCVFSKIRWYPINGGSSCLNRTVNRPDIVDNCAKLLKAICWKGYADIDIIQDPRDGVAKIMEINPRITGSVKICNLAGVDFAKIIVADYLGKTIKQQNAEENIYMRYIFTDILWFIKSPARFKTKPSWFKPAADQIFSISDPLPFFSYGLQGFMKIFADRKRRRI